MHTNASRELATLALDGPIATLTLCRPDRRNALSLDLIGSLRARTAELAELTPAQSPKVLLLRGQGKAFCAGMDLKAVLDDADAPMQLLGALAELTLELRSLSMVVIACVQGAAIGGGCGLSSVADISLTHDQAKIGYPEVDLGVCPAVVTPWLVQKVGAGHARQILLMGGLLTGSQAAAIGLVDRSLPDVQALDDAIEKLARHIAQGGKQALAATKALLNRLEGSARSQTHMAEAVREGAALSAKIVAGAEAQESLRKRFGSK